jgi:hypothetical protein
MEMRSRDVFAQQQRQRDFNCYYPSQLLENSACANSAFMTPPPTKPSFYLMNSQEERDEKKLRRGIRFLAKFYPNCSEYELIGALQECNLDEDQAFYMLEKRYDSFFGHEQQSMQRLQQIERSNQNSTSYQGASGQHSSMQSFLG